MRIDAVERNAEGRSLSVGGEWEWSRECSSTYTIVVWLPGTDVTGSASTAAASTVFYTFDARRLLPQSSPPTQWRSRPSWNAAKARRGARQRVLNTHAVLNVKQRAACEGTTAQLSAENELLISPSA